MFIVMKFFSKLLLHHRMVIKVVYDESVDMYLPTHNSEILRIYFLIPRKLVVGVSGK